MHHCKDISGRSTLRLRVLLKFAEIFQLRLEMYENNGHLHEGLHAFLGSQVTRCGTPKPLRDHARESSVMTSSHRQKEFKHATLARKLTQTTATPVALLANVRGQILTNSYATRPVSNLFRCRLTLSVLLYHCS
jgi:hypothetical protein